MAVLPLVSGVGASLTDPVTLAPAYRISLLACAVLMFLGGVVALVTIPASYSAIRPPVADGVQPVAAGPPDTPIRIHCAVGAPPLHPPPRNRATVGEG